MPFKAEKGKSARRTSAGGQGGFFWIPEAARDGVLSLQSTVRALRICRPQQATQNGTTQRLEGKEQSAFRLIECTVSEKDWALLDFWAGCARPALWAHRLWAVETGNKRQELFVCFVS